MGDWYEANEEKLVVDFRDEVNHAERNDLILVEKTMLLDESV